MVDFQSRDTRRESYDDEDDGVEEDETTAGSEETDDEQPAAETADQFDPATLRYAVVTVSAERSRAEDSQGDVVVDAIEDNGGVVSTRDLIRPSYDGVQSTVSALADRGDVDAIVTIGGTGIEPDDVTTDAVEPLFDKHLPGFGELFRLLAHEDRGSAVIGTRTTAGIIDAVPVFSIPGTVDAALLAVDEIVLPEAGQLVEDAKSD